MEVTVSTTDGKDISINVTTKCDTWDAVAHFIRDFKTNIPSNEDGETPSLCT